LFILLAVMAYGKMI